MQKSELNLHKNLEAWIKSKMPTGPNFVVLALI